jgi:ribosome-binding protein aMBF1 (putative translation factor)
MSSPATILTAIKIGESILRKEHKAMDNLWQLFGASVRSKRALRGWSQARLGRALGCSPQMIAAMESGERAWTKVRAALAAKLLARPEQWPDGGR